MTEQELREKIVFAIERGLEKAGYIYTVSQVYCVADELIAAGMSELKKHRAQIMKDGTIQQLYSGEEVEQIVKERDEYKHRAEVAERALRNICTNIRKDSGDIDDEIKTNSNVLYKAYLKQAEKELQEERKE